MTEFEYKVNQNKDKKGATINVVVLDLNKDESFSADIIAKNLSEIDSTLPQGFEMDKANTLSNYFSPDTVKKWEIELVNSQYIYFTNFQILVAGGFEMYVETLKRDDSARMQAMDNKVKR